jgi:hypothetical protein
MDRLLPFYTTEGTGSRTKIILLTAIAAAMNAAVLGALAFGVTAGVVLAVRIF